VVSLSGWHDVEWLWLWAGWPLEQLLPWGRAVANLQSEWVYHPLSGGMTQVVLGILAVVLLIAPGNLKSRFLVMTLALPLLLPSRPPTALPDLNTEVIVLDVGQGTAVVVRSGTHTLLYDTGGGDPTAMNMGLKVVLPFLQTRGITELDTMIISHPDTDHSAGTDVILKHHRVNRFRYGGEKTTAGIGRPCIAGESWGWPGGQKFQFLSPASELLEHSNNNSCVLQIQVGDYRLLLPGDIQGKRERDLVQYWVDDLASDWLLVPHHGSKTSSVPSVLKRVRPNLAMVSSGYANRFGHPHPNVVQRLEAGQTQIWSTAEHGALTLELAPGKTPRVIAYRPQIRRYWM
jgi:competence protein ComEC